MTNLEELLELAKTAMKIAPGQWDTDTIDNEGAYGSGEDVHEGFKSYVVGCGPVDNWKAIADSSNSDLILVEEDYDIDHHAAWDENSRVLFKFIAAANPSVIIDLLTKAKERETEAWNAGRDAAKDKATGWLVSFENAPEITYISPRQYAVDAVKDIVDSISALTRPTTPPAVLMEDNNGN